MRIVICLMVVLTAAVVAAPPAGGQCYTTPVVTTSYATPTYVNYATVVKEVVTPVAVPVYVPAYGAVYTPPAAGYVSAACNCVKEKETVSEMKTVLESLKAIDGRLKALEVRPPAYTPPPAPATGGGGYGGYPGPGYGTGGGAGYAPAAPGGYAPSTGGALPPQAPAGYTPGAASVGGTTNGGAGGSEGDVLPLVMAKCAKCHEARVAASEGAGLVMVENGALTRLDATDALRVIKASYKGTMPKRNSGIAPLTDAEVAALVGHYGQGSRRAP